MYAAEMVAATNITSNKHTNRDMNREFVTVPEQSGSPSAGSSVRTQQFGNAHLSLARNCMWLIAPRLVYSNSFL